MQNILNSRLGAALQIFVFALAIFAPGSAVATPAKEAPWLPEAAAYRLTLFLGNLAPIPWDEVENAWRVPYHGSEFSDGAVARLSRNSALSTEAVLLAIGARDRQAIFAEATRLIASRIEEELDRAMAAGSATPAQASVSEARGLYRAFEDHLKAADPDAARTLGRAWLQLSSNAGSAGVLGVGAQPSDRRLMTEARQTISNYLVANYLVAEFAPRNSLTAVPETVHRAGTPISIPAALPPGADIFDQDPLPRLVLNFEEQGIDETDLPLIAYGDMLFDSAQIFGGPAQELGITCSTCHNRSDINNRLFIPGASHQPGSVDVDGAFFNPMFNDRRDDPIDIPSLRGLRFTGPYGRDGRFASLRDFTRNVIVNEFAGPEPTPFMLDALLAYMIEFDFLPNSLLNSDGTLAATAPEAARRGEAIFNQPFAGMGGNACASCHVPSANFMDRNAYDIGSVASAYEGARSGALDTPTLLGSLYTAPYFHDGALPTMASVVDWFDDAKGLGLNETDRMDLTSYLETVGAADEPYTTFDDRATPFRLAFDELTTFASTLDTLLPARDKSHVLLLTDTVAADLAADASTMSNHAARPEIYALSRYLADVGVAVRADDWGAAEAAWSEFQRYESEIKERVY
ncbi:cytochrome c peroxidase [Sulfitobacter sp. CW3]|uniref:cytochrome c peroxidase n=1 Tax=Sulfitobacter sp. CW3 TaxID=2861965 RepID=UPI001C5D015D|nr:cytochrome c peroxidase [Sulfitobacter sp. CW3]MBW4964110.1 cytochrome C [Sulfitobacter sp. CW3]